MRHFWKTAALIAVLLLIATGCEKDEFTPVTTEENAVENVEFRNRAALPPEILTSLQRVEAFKGEVTSLMLQRKLPSVNGIYINSQLRFVPNLLKGQEITGALAVLQDLENYIDNLHNAGIITDEVYAKLHTGLLEIMAPVDPSVTLTFTDPRDGQVYPYIVLPNGQKWMAHNLNYDMTGSWYYNDDPGKADPYGRLYTWDAALDACPPGWRVPTMDEVGEMLLLFDPTFDISNSYWVSVPAYEALIAGGSSGFDAVFGGYRFEDGGYSYLGDYGFYWTATPREVIDYGINTYFFSSYGNMTRGSATPLSGASCRCLQDQ